MPFSIDLATRLCKVPQGGPLDHSRAGLQTSDAMKPLGILVWIMLPWIAVVGGLS